MSFAGVRAYRTRRACLALLSLLLASVFVFVIRPASAEVMQCWRDILAWTGKALRQEAQLVPEVQVSTFAER
jgi:hypothetical protein